MSIRTMLDELVRLQEGLSITSPVKQSITKAYKYAPSAKTGLKTPFWINTWAFGQQDDVVVEGTANYTVTMQLFCEYANFDRGIDIATAFHEAFLTAYTANRQLKTTANVKTAIQTSLRGPDPTIAGLDFHGQTYPGLTMFLDAIVSN